MYSRLGIFSFILLISGISSVLSGKFVYECERKRIKTLEEKIIDLNIELLKCKHELKTLEETNRFRESYLQLEKCMKRIENKENRPGGFLFLTIDLWKTKEIRPRGFLFLTINL